MRRLLVVTPSELTRDPRARRAALAARRSGYEVVGLSGQVSGETPIALEGIEIVRLAGERVAPRLRQAGLGGMRRSSPLVRELRGLFRLARTAKLTVALIRAGRRLPRAEVVHANDFDTLPAALLLGRRWRARLVYDAHELYTAQEPDPPRVQRAVVSRLEAAFARRADAVTTVSQPIADELTRRLRLRTAPIAVLSCPELVPDVEVDSGEGPLRVVYQGAMGPGRPLGDLLVAARAAPSAHFSLRVAGAPRDELQRATRGLANVVALDPVDPDRLVEALRGFEVGVVINRPVTRNDELVFPNKLFEYLMAGLAVAVPRLPGMAPLVESEQIGVTYEPGRPEELGAALEGLARDRTRLRAMRERARELAVTRYNAEQQSAQLAEAWGTPSGA